MSSKKKLKESNKKGGEQESLSPLQDAYVQKAKELRTRYSEQCVRFATSPLQSIIKRIESVIEKADILPQLVIANQFIKPNDITALRIAFKEYSHLRSVCFWNVLLDPSSLTTLFDFAESKPTLKSLQIHNAGIGKQHSHVLAAFGASCSHLHILSLDHNPLGNVAKDFTMALAQNSTNVVSTLSLRFCQIPSSCGKFLANLIKNSAKLVSIDLRGNILGDKGLIGLSYALEDNQTLKSLNLAFNEIEDIAIDNVCPFETLCQTIGFKNTVLSKIDLTGNFIGDHGMTKVLQMVQNRKSLYGVDKASPLQCMPPERVTGGLFDCVWEMNNMMDLESKGKKKKKIQKKK